MIATTIDFARARRTMVDTQIRVNDVTDPPLIAAFLAVPREAFVADSWHSLAYLDADIDAAGDTGRALMKPMVLAKLIQALAIRPGDKVLSIGGGTGYGAALCARLDASVTALEDTKALTDAASMALAKADSSKVTLVTGPLADGHADGAPFDAILVEGAVEAIPDRLIAQLAEGGRLVAILGEGRAAKAVLYHKTNGEIGSRPLFDAALKPLPGFAVERGFVF